MPLHLALVDSTGGIVHGLRVVSRTNGGNRQRSDLHVDRRCGLETGDLRLRRGGAHASFGRDTKISIAYGPQTNLEIDLDPECRENDR